MESVKAWLNLFAELVRARDPESAEALFAANVHSYGSVARVTQGLNRLREQQWNQVWPVTHGFQFLDQSVNIALSPDGLMATVFAQWESTAEQSGLRREGRATIVLRRSGSAVAWQAIHTHFSLSPTRPL